MTDRDAIRQFARLRWRLLRSILRSDGPQRWAVLLGLVGATIAGGVGGLMVFTAGRRLDDPDPVFVIAAAAVPLVVTTIVMITGITQPVDPRVLATEPLSDRQLGLGLLTASAVGPPAIASLLFGAGLLAGAVRGAPTVLPVALGVLALLLSLLLIARTVINVLAVLATRFPRIGQLVVGLSSLAFYAAVQLLSQFAPALGEADRRKTLADAAAWSPPGQLGRSIGAADESIGAALVHLVAGSAWLVALAWLYVWSTRRLLLATERTTAADRSVSERSRRASSTGAIRRLCGSGPTGAVAWRGLLTRLRTPRTILETVTGGGVGLAIVLVPTLVRDQPGGGAVLVGGAVQFAVLFFAGNSFGSDGPALASELLAGVDPKVLVAAKARSVAIVAIPLAVAGPLVAAGVTGEWSFLPAGFLVGAGGLLAGTGGAVVQSTLVPVAVPDSDNPLASGDTGKGCLAGLLFAAVVASLAILTLPVAILLLWAVERGSVGLSTTFAAGSLLAGAGVYAIGVRFAASKWRRSEPEIYEAVVPAR